MSSASARRLRQAWEQPGCRISHAPPPDGSRTSVAQPSLARQGGEWNIQIAAISCKKCGRFEPDRKPGRHNKQARKDQVWLLTLQTDTLFEGLRPASGLGGSMWVQGAGMEREWCGLARDDTDEAVGSETSVALADDGFEATVRHIAPSAAALEHRPRASGLRILPCGDV